MNKTNSLSFLASQQNLNNDTYQLTLSPQGSQYRSIIIQPKPCPQVIKHTYPDDKDQYLDKNFTGQTNAQKRFSYHKNSSRPSSSYQKNSKETSFALRKKILKSTSKPSIQTPTIEVEKLIKLSMSQQNSVSKLDIQAQKKIKSDHIQRQLGKVQSQMEEIDEKINQIDRKYQETSREQYHLIDNSKAVDFIMQAKQTNFQKYSTGAQNTITQDSKQQKKQFFERKSFLPDGARVKNLYEREQINMLKKTTENNESSDKILSNIRKIRPQSSRDNNQKSNNYSKIPELTGKSLNIQNLLSTKENPEFQQMQINSVLQSASNSQHNQIQIISQNSSTSNKKLIVHQNTRMGHSQSQSFSDNHLKINQNNPEYINKSHTSSENSPQRIDMNPKFPYKTNRLSEQQDFSEQKQVSDKKLRQTKSQRVFSLDMNSMNQEIKQNLKQNDRNQYTDHLRQGPIKALLSYGPFKIIKQRVLRNFDHLEVLKEVDNIEDIKYQRQNLIKKIKESQTTIKVNGAQINTNFNPKDKNLNKRLDDIQQKNPDFNNYIQDQNSRFGKIYKGSVYRGYTGYQQEQYQQSITYQQQMQQIEKQRLIRSQSHQGNLQQ